VTADAVDDAEWLAKNGWKLDPARMAAELNPKGYQRYAYSDLFAQVIVDGATGRYPRQIVNCQPQLGKTTTITVWGATWFLEMWPEKHLISMSYGDMLAKRIGRGVRNNFRDHADRLTTRLAPDSQAAGMFSTNAGGGLLATSIDGTSTGVPAHGLLIDDPIKGPKEAHSQTIRDNTWDFIQAAGFTRLQDVSFVVIAMTRWHEADPVGRFLKEQPDTWHVVRLPALAEPTEAQPDPLGRARGEVVEPRRFSRATIEDRKSIGSYLFNGLYQQRPAPAEGGILKRAWWQRYSFIHRHDLDEFLISWDMSFSDAEDSDFVVGQVWARSGASKILVDQVRAQMDYPTTRRAVIELARKWPEARTILVEDKANGPAIIADLRNTVSGLVPVTPKGSKESRVNAVAGDIESGHVYIPRTEDVAWVGDFVDECAAFPNGANDDVVDAMSQALLRWSNRDSLGQDTYSNVPARGRR
jgi:predicted phage terminase large subunit-like protein